MSKQAETSTDKNRELIFQAGSSNRSCYRMHESIFSSQSMTYFPVSPQSTTFSHITTFLQVTATNPTKVNIEL